MTAPNINTLWGRAVVDELARAGIDAAVVAPGSRSTPLTVAFANHPDVEVYSHLDERSAGFFALGRAKRTGRPTPLVCTSGTALANFHPAVVEANQARVPMLLLTANRPPELQDSGANQTIDQEQFYSNAVRTYRKLPEPEATDRKFRSLRTSICRAVSMTTSTPPGPVHLDFPFRKPLEPTIETNEIPDGWETDHPVAAHGRPDGRPYVRSMRSKETLGQEDLEDIANAIEGTDRGLIVAGPTDAAGYDSEAVSKFARATGFPVLADPLSGVRFGPNRDVVVCGGYDSWVAAEFPAPDLVIRFGASPTSKALRKALAETSARQLLVDPGDGWREAEFAATDLVGADPSWFARAMAAGVDREPTAYSERLADLELNYWRLVGSADGYWEGRVLGDVTELVPEISTLFVSNSMPVRDLDRFGRPREADITVLGNRGASGIDGISSTALGAGSAADEPLVCVTGDLAYYHDTNGLLAVQRFDLDATIVLVNNDGGGIFHLLPIEEHDTFEYFQTPHGLDFEPTGDLYGFEFARAGGPEAFRDLFRESVTTDGTQVIEVTFDAEVSHQVRERLQDRIESELP